MTANIDEAVVDGFGDEWSRFDQSGAPSEDLSAVFDQYFAVFPWSELPTNASGFDAGCGSGRWARLVAPRVGTLHCVDASEQALGVAQRMLRDQQNTRFHHASIDSLPFPDDSMDFGYSLGVLHHMPDTAGALRACVTKLKPGAPFLLYLYYAFDNRPAWFRALWRASDLGRQAICRLPHGSRYAASQAIAGAVYWPLARTARLAERLGAKVDSFPLSAYRDRSFYMMRNDALDRFGTRLEQRFTRKGMHEMMTNAGLSRIRFHEGTPFWCAVGYKDA